MQALLGHHPVKNPTVYPAPSKSKEQTKREGSRVFERGVLGVSHVERTRPQLCPGRGRGSLSSSGLGSMRQQHPVANRSNIRPWCPNHPTRPPRPNLQGSHGAA